MCGQTWAKIKNKAVEHGQWSKNKRVESSKVGFDTHYMSLRMKLLVLQVYCMNLDFITCRLHDYYILMLHARVHIVLHAFTYISDCNELGSAASFLVSSLLRAF